MYCRFCGAELPDGASVCAACGGAEQEEKELAKQTVEENGDENPKENEGAYVRFRRIAYDVFSGPLFLALTIAMTAYVAFLIADGMSGIVSIVLGGLTTVGLWLLYTGARKGNMPLERFGLVVCYPKLVQIVAYVLGGCLLVCIPIIAVAFPALQEALLTEDWVSLGLSAEEMEAIGLLSDLTLGLVIAVMVLALATQVLAIVRYTILLSYIKRVRHALTTGALPKMRPRAFAILSFIMAFVDIAFATPTLFDSSLAAMAEVAGAAATVLTGVILLTFDAPIRALYELQEKEREESRSL